MKSLYAFIFILLIILAYLNNNVLEKFNSLLRGNLNYDNERFPSCFKDSRLAQRMFHIMERNGLKNSTIIPQIYNLVICFVENLELDLNKCSDDSIKKQINLMETIAKKRNINIEINNNNLIERFINMAIYSIEEDLRIIPLHPDDIKTINEINNEFYNKYVSKLKQYCNN
jgi:hypothetical protein